MVVRVVVGSHQDPTGVLQKDLIENHLGKWLMGGEEEECVMGGGEMDVLDVLEGKIGA